MIINTVFICEKDHGSVDISNNNGSKKYQILIDTIYYFYISIFLVVVIIRLTASIVFVLILYSIFISLSLVCKFYADRDVLIYNV